MTGPTNKVFFSIYHGILMYHVTKSSYTIIIISLFRIYNVTNNLNIFTPLIKIYLFYRFFNFVVIIFQMVEIELAFSERVYF